MTDKEILELIKESISNLDLLYGEHKNYCMNFMNKMNYNPSLNEDVFHDTLILLYEKLCKGTFELTNKSTIQTYLNAVCKNQVLIRLKKENKQADYTEQFDERMDDWFENEDRYSEKSQAVALALDKLKEFGGKCYEILTSYFYQNKSMEQIAYEFDYTNKDNAKHQKSRCQKRLKELSFEFYKK